MLLAVPAVAVAGATTVVSSNAAAPLVAVVSAIRAFLTVSTLVVDVIAIAVALDDRAAASTAPTTTFVLATDAAVSVSRATAAVEALSFPCCAADPFPERTMVRTAAGALDKASATTFVDPGRFSILKSYSCSVRDQRWSRPAKFGLVINHFSADWSVMIQKVLPYRYGLKRFTAQTTAKHSSSVIE
eukprot:jgi/Phyca11/115729/e_gw1.29.495.1